MNKRFFLSIYHIVLFIYALVAVSVNTAASSFRPIITNFTAATYHGGLQNWALGQDKNGNIYVGNNLGLLCYDSYSWSLIKMPTSPTIRSVLVDGNRIYVGSYEEFGFFEPDAQGILNYTSLSASIDKAKMHEDDIWNIIKANGCIYFQSFSSWFLFDGKKTSIHHDNKMAPLYFHEAFGKVYVQMMNGDFFRLDGDKYTFLFSRADIGDDTVVAIIPTADKKMILCTEWHGLFNFDGVNLSKRQTAIDTELYRQQINRATLIPSDSTIVIGTILNGIYAISPSGDLRWHYNVSNGMHNNSILRLLCDKANNIWAATDNGIALIHSGSPYSILSPERAEPSIGMVYGISFFNRKMFLATNQGLYTHDKGAFSMVPNTNGQNWHATNLGNQLLIGNNDYTKLISADSSVPSALHRARGSSTCIVECKINGQDILLESSYSPLRIYRRNGSNWELSNEVFGFAAPVRHLEVDHTGTIWAAHMSKGLFRIQLDKTLSHVVKSELITQLAPNGQQGTMMVMKIRGRVVFSDGSALYTYDDISHKITPMTELNKIITKPIISSSPIDDDTFWLVSNSDYAIVKYNANGSYSILNVISSKFLGAECNEFSNGVTTLNGKSYLFVNNGVILYDINKIPLYPKPDTHLFFASIESVNKDFKSFALPLNTDKDHRAESSPSISFRLSYPYYGASPLKYSFKLSGSVDLSSFDSKPEVSYSSLAYGDYTLAVDVISSSGRVLSSSYYYFTVPKPFYISYFAILIYILILFAIGYFIARWRAGITLKKKRKEFEEEKLKQDVKMLEQERIIAQQQQQLLEAELSSKGKEIASMALDVVAKNKIIDSFRESIKQQRDSLSKDSLHTLMSNLDASSDSKEFWEIYQKNFDLIHDNFFRNLRAKYPALTASDLKFCALLRLNLTSKEISQFTNLTIRGVEAARYRLRKKFALAEGTNLVDFLIDFK